MNDPYDLWKRARADVPVPEGFADRVMSNARRRARPPWGGGLAVAAALALVLGMAALQGAVVATVVLAAPAAAE
jgi:hypothetical protein